MNRIINPQQIQRAAVKIEYKTEHGTGFFITNVIILTAYHIFLDSVINDDEVKIIINDKSQQKAKIISIDEENDICLLGCASASESFLPLLVLPLRLNENWESFGFPYSVEQEGLRIRGTIKHLVENERYDFVANCHDIDKYFNFEGLSGAPVVVAGKVIGMVLRQIDDKIGVVSIAKIAHFLQDAGILIQTEESVNDIPRQFEVDIKNIASNYFVLNKLEDCINEDGNYILLEGNPGTGKTLNVATYIPDDNNVVIGKYFTKIPNDDKPKSLRVSKEYFLGWLHETITLLITGELPARNNDSFNTRLENLAHLFADLASHLKGIEKNGILFLDGLDEIYDLEDFLGIIPIAVSRHVKIVLSCTTREILPSGIKNSIASNQIVLVKPLEIDECEFYIQRNLDEKISYENIQKVAAKSEGHALYLNYLVDYIKLSEISKDPDELDEWIENIPSISGDIVNYYNSIWDRIFENKNKLWICLILSQLRQPIAKQDFFEMLPLEIRTEFYSTFPKISYLFKDSEDEMEIYHNSFKDFILEKTPLLRKDCNDLIARFCGHNPDRKYALTNNLYHYALSSSPQKAVNSCNQVWADKMAIEHIEPDLIISDIKTIIKLAIELEIATDVIRLLLLLQRIDFRYNSVFVEYADQIALALIANRKYEHALKYIVRRNQLLVGNEDALVFLQLFYENDAFTEARILLEAIESRHRLNMRKMIETEGGLDPAFITYKAQTLTLTISENFEGGNLRLADYMNFLKKLSDSYPDNKKIIDNIIEIAISWDNAYFLRISDQYRRVKEISEESRRPLSRKWAQMLLRTKFFYSDILRAYNTAYFKKNENEHLITEDLELLIEMYGFDKDHRRLSTILKILLKETTRPELLRPIASAFLNLQLQTELRSENGVDFVYSSFMDLSLQHNCEGFLDDSDEYPISGKNWDRSGWENDLLKLIEEINFMEGKSYYYKSASKLAEKSGFIKTKLGAVIDTMKFSFSKRTLWERSYQLPERIFPFIYNKIINLLNEFDREKLQSFLDTLTSKYINQLALYTEGYRAALHEICKALILIEFDKQKILPIVELWEAHILSGVQNRWERTEELLKINEIYGILGFEDKAKNNFQEMLNTSMGPSWYKESQFGAINTTLKNLKSEPSNLIIQNFAAILDHASGEMTFQRYVKYNKEDFIGALIINGKLNEALQYYKEEVLPCPAAIIRNAEISDFDAPVSGNGYVLGARNIIEQSGILKILEQAAINPYLKWALCEIFTVNDDIFRYVADYGSEIARALNEIEELRDGNINSICKSVADLIASGYIEIDDRRSMLRAIGKYLTASNVKRLQGFLLAHDISWGIAEAANADEQVPQTHKKDGFDLFNETLIAKKPESEAALKTGIETFKKERKSIWYTDWSNGHTAAKGNVKNLFKNDKAVITGLKENILTFDEEYWVIANEIIWFLQGKLDDLQTAIIYEIVNEHFRYIVRPTENVMDKYTWLDQEFANSNPDGLIIDFIIWHLNHPDRYIQKKVAEIMEKLASYFPQAIKSLIESCTSDKPELATQSSSKILKQIARTSPEVIIDCLTLNPELVDTIGETTHLTVKYNLKDVSLQLSQKGFSLLHLKIQSSIPSTVINMGEVYFEEPPFTKIQDILDELNSELHLDEAFCVKINELLDKYCYPLQKLDVQKSDGYLARSFYNEEIATCRYEYYLRHALNNAIAHRIDKLNIGSVYQIINA